MPGFIRRNFCLMLKRQPDIVKPLEQTVAGVFVDLEACDEALVVSYCAAFKVNG
jgi:hypothetical protein